MKGVEDIPGVVMGEGIPWSWKTFLEYPDALAQRSYHIDVAAQVPHGPIRIDVMGKVVEACGRLISFQLAQVDTWPKDKWQHLLPFIDQANGDGLQIRPPVWARPIGLLYRLELSLQPFGHCPNFHAISALSLAEQVAAMKLLGAGPLAMRTPRASHRHGSLRATSSAFVPGIPKGRITNQPRDPRSAISGQSHAEESARWPRIFPQVPPSRGPTSRPWRCRQRLGARRPGRLRRQRRRSNAASRLKSFLT